MSKGRIDANLSQTFHFDYSEVNYLRSEWKPGQNDFVSNRLDK